jgi:hypothetical protein
MVACPFEKSRILAIIRQKEKTLSQTQFSARLFYYFKNSKSIVFLKEQAKNLRFLGRFFSFFSFLQNCDFVVITTGSLKHSGYNVIDCPQVTKEAWCHFRYIHNFAQFKWYKILSKLMKTLSIINKTKYPTKREKKIQDAATQVFTNKKIFQRGWTTREVKCLKLPPPIVLRRTSDLKGREEHVKKHTH